MDVIHFPDDPRPSRWVAPGARARQLRRPAPRPPQDPRSHAARRRRARRDLGGHDLRSASAARRPARQGAAAADDQGAEARGDRRRRRAGRGDRALHARAVAVGAGDVRAHRARRLAARRRSVGRRELSVRPRSRRQLLAAARRSARATASRPRRSIRSATRTSSSAARASAGWSAKGASTRRARCSGISTSSTARSCSGDQRGRTIGFPTANLCTENELLPPHGVYATTATDRRRSCIRRSPTSACGRPSTTSGRTVDRDAHLRPRSRSVRPDRSASASCSGCATSARSSRWTRCARRSTPTASARACCSIAFHCRIPPVVPDHEFLFALDMSGRAAVRRACSPSWRAPCSATSAATSAAIDALAGELGAALTERRRQRRTPVRACGSARAPASCEIVVVGRRPAATGARPGRCRLPDRRCVSTTP